MIIPPTRCPNCDLGPAESWNAVMLTERTERIGEPLQRWLCPVCGYKWKGTEVTDPTEELLANRGKTHGDFADNARVSQALKWVIRRYINEHKIDLQMEHSEALDMILLKVSRAVTGNPNEADHWRDISGYAILAMKACQGSK